MTETCFSEWICQQLSNDNKKTQSDVARELLVNRSTINTWCNGSRLPSAVLKEKIASSSLFLEKGKENLNFVLLLCHNQEIKKSKKLDVKE
jgi:DNA-binding XRE family transcriptional regulator